MHHLWICDRSICNLHFAISNLQFLLVITPMLALFDPASSSALAAGQVQLELVGEARSSALSIQEWGQALAASGIKNVRLRTETEPAKIGIDVQGTADRPLYIVTGQVVSRDEIRLPGAIFKRNEVKRLAAWLDDLAQNGPPDKRSQIVAFGLTGDQFDRVIKDLSAPVGFSTKGITCRDAVEKIIKSRLRDTPVPAFPNDKIEDELSELSCGTALAYLLQSAGYCFMPQASGGQIKYTVMQWHADLKEVWPVGRQPEKPIPAILPGLFEMCNVNVQNIPAAATLETIAKRLKTPVLYDRAALAKQKIDPAKAKVSFPNARTNYSMALGRMLFPAGLRFEVRQDEAGMPFLWVFTLKP
jgi:hypothetical protein